MKEPSPGPSQLILNLMDSSSDLHGLTDQPARLLRFLALNHGREVPIDAAIDVLRASSRRGTLKSNAVHTYIGAIRKVIGDHRVETRSGDPTTYVLRLNLRPSEEVTNEQPDSTHDFIDVVRFADLRSRAAEQASGGDIAGAIATFEQLFGLWAANPARGLTFDDFNYDYLLRDELHFTSQLIEARLSWSELVINGKDVDRAADVIYWLERITDRAGSGAAGRLSYLDERLWLRRSAAHILKGELSKAADVFDQYLNADGTPSTQYHELLKVAEEEQNAATAAVRSSRLSIDEGLLKGLRGVWSDLASRTVAGSQRLHIREVAAEPGLWIKPRALDPVERRAVPDALAFLHESVSTTDADGPPRWVLLGSPGLGKSTLGILLYRRLLEDWTQQRSDRYPYYLDLRSVRSYTTQDLLQRDWLSEHIGRSLFSEAAYANWLSDLREKPRIVLIDSVDEFFQGRTKEEAKQLMSAPFLMEADLLMCRSQFFNQYIQASDLARRFAQVELSPWSPADRETYVDSYYRYFFPTRADELAEDLKIRMRRSSSMAQVCSSPVRLNMALELFSPGVDNLPGHVDLLSLYSCYLNYVAMVDASRAGSMTDANEKLELLKELAWRYYDEGSMGEADAPLFSYQELRSFIDDRFPDANPDDRSKILGDLLDSSIIESTREHRIDVGNNLLHFSHKSFQEYFVGTRVYESMVKDASNTLEVMKVYLSPEVGEFLKEHLQRVNHQPRMQRRVASNGLEALGVVWERRSNDANDDPSRPRITLEQLYYYIGGLAAQDVQSQLDRYLREEDDPWLYRGLAIGLAFSGRYDAVDGYIEKLSAERAEVGSEGANNAVNIGTQLSYFGDQPFDPAYPDRDLGAANCGRTVATFLYQLTTETERGCWRVDLFSLVDLWRFRPQSRESMQATLLEMAHDVKDVVAKLREDPFSCDWVELSDFAHIAEECGIEL